MKMMMNNSPQPGQLAYCDADNHYFGIGLVLQDVTRMPGPLVFSVLLSSGITRFCEFELTPVNFQDNHAN